MPCFSCICCFDSYLIYEFSQPMAWHKQTLNYLLASYSSCILSYIYLPSLGVNVIINKISSQLDLEKQPGKSFISLFLLWIPRTKPGKIPQKRRYLGIYRFKLIPASTPPFLHSFLGIPSLTSLVSRSFVEVDRSSSILQRRRMSLLLLLPHQLQVASLLMLLLLSW